MINIFFVNDDGSHHPIDTIEHWEPITSLAKFLYFLIKLIKIVKRYYGNLQYKKVIKNNATKLNDVTHFLKKTLLQYRHCEAKKSNNNLKKEEKPKVMI